MRRVYVTIYTIETCLSKVVTIKHMPDKKFQTHDIAYLVVMISRS